MNSIYLLIILDENDNNIIKSNLVMPGAHYFLIFIFLGIYSIVAIIQIIKIF